MDAGLMYVKYGSGQLQSNPVRKAEMYRDHAVQRLSLSTHRHNRDEDVMISMYSHVR